MRRMMEFGGYFRCNLSHEQVTDNVGLVGPLNTTRHYDGFLLIVSVLVRTSQQPASHFAVVRIFVVSTHCHHYSPLLYSPHHYIPLH